MATIPLTQGKQAVVCDCHYELVKDHKWFYHSGAGGYAARTVYSGGGRKKPANKTLGMHRVITDAPASMQVDHIDMDRLNNRCDNLRVCTRSQNYANQKVYKNNTSGYKGVNYNRALNKWVARVQASGRRIYLGAFNTAKEAAQAYNQKAFEVFGEYAQLNEIGK